MNNVPVASLSSLLKPLIDQAFEIREKAYAPFSKYKVGAAIMSNKGTVHTGYNVENDMYLGGIHAEQMAIADMRKVPNAKINTLIVAAEDGGMPCGFCRQQIISCAGDGTIILGAGFGECVDLITPAELLPRDFEWVNASKDTSDRLLVEYAYSRMERAYSPYSKCMESGASVLTWDGSIFSGTRVEDIIWEGQHAICNALAEMISQGCKGPVKKVVIAQQGKYEPCGHCLQKLVEFAGLDFPDKKDIEIIMPWSEFSENHRRGLLSKLLPFAFNPACLKG